RSRFATRNLLVMGQLALSLVTLTAAGLFIRSATESAVADPGFTFERGIMANVDPSLAGRNAVVTHQFYEKALDRVRSMPGVVAPSHHQLLEHEMRPHIFTPVGQDFRSSLYIHLKTSAPTADAESAMLPDVRRELLALDPSLPIISLETRPMFRERNFILWV